MDAGGGGGGRSGRNRERERLKNKHAGGRVGGNAERVGLRSSWLGGGSGEWEGGYWIDLSVDRPTDDSLSLEVGVENGAVFRSHFIAIIAIAIIAPAFLSQALPRYEIKRKGPLRSLLQPCLLLHCNAPKEISHFVVKISKYENGIAFTSI